MDDKPQASPVLFTRRPNSIKVLLRCSQLREGLLFKMKVIFQSSVDIISSVCSGLVLPYGFLHPTFLFFSRYAGHSHPCRAGLVLVGLVLTSHLSGWTESSTSTNWPSFRTKLSLFPLLGLQCARATYISNV